MVVLSVWNWLVKMDDNLRVIGASNLYAIGAIGAIGDIADVGEAKLGYLAGG